MRDATNAADPAASVQSLVSMILGKKGTDSSNFKQEKVAPAPKTTFAADEIPSPPKHQAADLDQENDWGDSVRAMERSEASPVAEKTIRLPASAHSSAAGAPLDVQQTVQMPSPMKFEGDAHDVFEEGAQNADQFDQTVPRGVNASQFVSAPTTTFVLSRATMPEEDDDVNESVAERTITKLNPKWLPPTQAGRPQLIQISQIQQLQRQSQAVKTHPEPRQQDTAGSGTEESILMDATMVEATMVGGAGIEEPVDSSSTIGAQTGVDESNTEDTATEPSTSESDTSSEETEIARTEVEDREKRIAADAAAAEEVIDAALLRRRLPLQDAIMFVMHYTPPSMPKRLERIAALFSLAQLQRVVGPKTSAEAIEATCRHLIAAGKIEELQLVSESAEQSDEHGRFWRAILPQETNSDVAR